jgi:predicted lipoprotein
VLLAACNEPGPSGPERGDVIADLVSQVLAPAHAELSMPMNALAGATMFCENGDPLGLGEVQVAWRTAHQAFGRTEAFGYGPAMDEHYDAALLFWPTRPDTLESLVVGTDPIDDALVAGLGAASKGLPALEAQLFDPIGGEMSLGMRFADDEAGMRRCTLVRLIAGDASEAAEALMLGWTTDGSFGEELATAGQGSARYPSVQAGIDEIVNGVIAVLQLIDDTKLGKPLGTKTGGVPQPDLVPSPYADDSIAMIRANLEGVASVWKGGGGLGLRDLVAARSETLAADVDAAIDAADAALAAIDQPLRTAVVDAPAQVQSAIDRIKDLRRLFTVDVAQQLDVTVTLSDNDGD